MKNPYLKQVKNLYLSLLSLHVLCSYCWAEGIAVIVNKTNQIDSLSVPQIARIYKGQQQYWPDGNQIVLVNRPVDTAIRELFYQKVLGEDKSTRKFYLPGSPIPISSNVQKSPLATIKFVGGMPEAIGYVYLSELEQDKPNEDIRLVQVIEIEDNRLRSGGGSELSKDK